MPSSAVISACGLVNVKRSKHIINKLILAIIVTLLLGCSEQDEKDFSAAEDMDDYLISERLNYDPRTYPAMCYEFAKDFYLYLNESLVPLLENKEYEKVITLRKENKHHYRNLTPCASAQYIDHKPAELNFEFYGHVAVTLGMIDMYMKWYVDDPKEDCPCLMALEEAKKLQKFMVRYNHHLALNNHIQPTHSSLVLLMVG